MQPAPPDGTPGAIATVWRILKAQNEDEIQRQLVQWFSSAQPDPELAPFDIPSHIARRDWNTVKDRLEHRFGRYHPHYKPLIDVLMAAAQSRRMLQARGLQKLMDELRSSDARGRTL